MAQTIYVSSTTTDLGGHRDAVIKMLRRNYDVVGMHRYTAVPEAYDAWRERCCADVEKCDLYVGLFAWRYGSRPQNEDRSYTHLELLTARDVGRDRLLFLAGDDWPRHLRDGGEDADRIAALRAELGPNGAGVFGMDPDELANMVDRAVSGRIQERLSELQNKLRPEVPDPSSHDRRRNRFPLGLPPVRTFVDREREREELRRCLEHGERGVVQIAGHGGYGKTALIAWRLGELVKDDSGPDSRIGVLFVRCNERDVGLGSIFELAGEIAGKREEFRDEYADPSRPLRQKLDFFFTELARHGGAWIVFDNLESLVESSESGEYKLASDELNDLLEYAATTPECRVRVIVTTRVEPAVRERLESIVINEGLPEDEAIYLLRREGGDDLGLWGESDDDLRELVNRVHRIPKALHTLLGHLQKRFAPHDRIRKILADDALFAEFDAADAEAGQRHLIREQIETLNGDDRLVIAFLAAFPHGVRFETLQVLLEPNLGQHGLTEALQRLDRNHHLIECDRDLGLYDMHPLDREVVYGLLGDD